MRRAKTAGWVAGLSAVIIIAAIGLGRSDTTRPADSQRITQTAKDFGMTPEQLAQFVRLQLGDPVVVDNGLIVGVKRDAGGHVATVVLHLPEQDVTFNRNADPMHHGLDYISANLTRTPNLSTATDLDGDGRIDQIILTAPGEPHPHILLRIGVKFVDVTTIDGKRFKTADGHIFHFEFSRHEWVE